MDINQAMRICFKKGIKVYPVIVKPIGFKVEVDIDGKLKRFKNIFNSKEINEAITKTYKYYARTD